MVFLVAVSRIQRVLVANPKKLLNNVVANSARGLLNREIDCPKQIRDTNLINSEMFLVRRWAFHAWQCQQHVVRFVVGKSNLDALHSIFIYCLFLSYGYYGYHYY